MPKRYTLSDYWLFYTAGMSIGEIIKDILESYFKRVVSIVNRFWHS
jgi:hypothetical protein